MVNKTTTTKNKVPIVCDVGSDTIKIGFAGSLTPAHIIPNIIAFPRQIDNLAQKSYFVGYEALKIQNRKKCNLVRPIDEYCTIKNWEALETILKYSFQVIGIDGIERQQRKILFTISNACQDAKSEKLFALFLNRLGFAAAATHPQEALILYTYGLESAVIVSLGDAAGSVVPVYKGFALQGIDKRIKSGGRCASTHMGKLLRMSGYHVVDVESGRLVKDLTSYTALSYGTEERLAAETTILMKSVQLPEGSEIHVGKERFETGELFFQPTRFGKDQAGIAHLVANTIREAAMDCRADLYKNVVLAGGTTLMPGFAERFEKDLIGHLKKDNRRAISCNEDDWKIKVHASSTRMYAVFEGAALFADYIHHDCTAWKSICDHLEGNVIKFK